MLSDTACCGSNSDSDLEEPEEGATAFVFLNLDNQRKHGYWVNKVNKRREKSDEHHRLLKDLEEDESCRMHIRLTSLVNKKSQFKVALKRYLNTHSFYYVDEFLMFENDS
jgi:hypothetical protein